jgi:nucleotide-binding universal stress UspA family protein
MKTRDIPSALPQFGVGATRWTPVVVATDGRTQSDSALILGRLLAGSDDALRLVTVLRPIPILPNATIPVTPDLTEARLDEVRRDVESQMNRAWDSAHPIDIREGDPASAVCDLARDTHATMIVCGLGRHRVSDRVFGDETALRLMRMADVPVLAASSRATQAPRRIVVACDFSESSVSAARLAIEIAAPGAHVDLVHVTLRDTALAGLSAWGTMYKHDAADALRDLSDRLRVPVGMNVKTTLLQGDPATELLAFAASVNADMIVTGSHGQGFIARMLIGSVTTRLVRCATCSVLTVPVDATATPHREATPASTAKTSDSRWDHSPCA